MNNVQKVSKQVLSFFSLSFFLYILSYSTLSIIRFIPKEDIASSTSIKSSVQRSIRSKLIAQIPLLSSPSLPLPVNSRNKDDSDDESGSESEEEVIVKKKKGAAKEKKSKGGKGGGKKEEVVQQEEEVVEEDKEEVLTLLDVLWPKKEGLTLIKWLV